MSVGAQHGFDDRTRLIEALFKRPTGADRVNRLELEPCNVRAFLRGVRISRGVRAGGNPPISDAVHDMGTPQHAKLRANPHHEDAPVITFLIGLSLGASLGVVVAGVCFASHERQADTFEAIEDLHLEV
jgi:hypothetical protein